MRKVYRPSINLKSLLAKNQIVRLNLTEYLTWDQVKELKHEYLDDTYVHHVIHSSTAGFLNNKLAFLYLKGAIEPKYIRRAERGLSAMRWDKASNSLRKAVKSAKDGFELHFGWRRAFGEIKQFAPTLKQSAPYSHLHPLINRMDGLFQRIIPGIWRNALTGQRSTNFRRSAHTYTTFSSIQLLRNAPTSIHLDPKNAPDSMSVLTTCGKYTGGEFMFPAYGVSIPNQPGDVIIAATFREWHCNFKMVEGLKHSVIGYFGENLRNT